MPSQKFTEMSDPQLKSTEILSLGTSQIYKKGLLIRVQSWVKVNKISIGKCGCRSPYSAYLRDAPGPLQR